MTTSVRGWSAFVVAFSIGSAFAQLNPTVKVLPKPQSSVPPECEEGLAPATPRVIIAEAAPEEKKPVPPPSLDLKTRLRAAQIAAEANDRDAFKAALADARSAVNSYPAGGERSAATDVLNVYNDLERLWDYQFTSPVGAFFDSSTDFVGMMRRYSNYQSAIADQTLTVNGQTIYPTEETRKFLIAEAAQRLDRLGVRTPTRIVQVPEKPVPQPRVTPPPAPVPTSRKKPAPQPRVATKKPKPSTHKAQHAKKPETKIAEAKTAPAMPRHVQPAPQPKPAPPPAPAPQPEPVPQPAPPAPVQPASAPAPAPQPQPQPPPTTTTAVPAPQPQPSTTTTASTQPPSTATTATTATTSTAPENAPAQGGRMNLLFAVILIIVGIGVLIVLFRASD